ncbi:MAG: asparagine synthase (glutamine-hydrolyzing) [Actinomycetota bacterium]
MCGIVGAISNAPIKQKLIEEMRDRLEHRGPDHAGIWLAPDARVCFGHRRLSIIDLSPEANQPFISHDGRYVITFNGEIYNFKALREDLEAHGIKFYTDSDTEVLIESYRQWGARCLERLSGMFAFAIWDKAEKHLFCARDRAGEKPFYYTMLGDSFVFASEVKALLPYPGFRRNIDYTALIDFLTFGFVAEPKSIWKDCYKLPPGNSMSVWIKPDGSLKMSAPTPYWDWEFNPDYAVSDWSPQILEALQTASKEMSFADVPVGTFLSGGVDSSSVTAALSKAGCAVQTFTIGFDEQGYDERPWARQVAELYGTVHTEKTVRADDITADFQKLLWHYDEPFNDYSYLPTYHVCREARKSITVALSGDGGDEMFGGYRKYQRLGMRQNIQRFMPAPLNSVTAFGANLLFPETSRFRRTVLQHTLDVPTMMFDAFNLGFAPSVLRPAARGALAETLQNYSPRDVVSELLKKAPPDEVGLINSMRYLDLKLTLAGDILVKVDRASMAVSLEVRPVYLHREILELAEKIPPHLLADRRHAKEVLKRALKPWLPDSVLYRRKQGFAMPLKNWIGESLQQLFTQTDTENPLDELLDPKLLQTMADKHISQGIDLTANIHSLFFLQHWITKWT